MNTSIGTQSGSADRNPHVNFDLTGVVVNHEVANQRRTGHVNPMLLKERENCR